MTGADQSLCAPATCCRARTTSPAFKADASVKIAVGSGKPPGTLFRTIVPATSTSSVASGTKPRTTTDR
jgi:hypothetical protein